MIPSPSFIFPARFGKRCVRLVGILGISAVLLAPPVSSVAQTFSLEGSVVPVPSFSSSGGVFSLVASAGEPVLPTPSASTNGTFSIDHPVQVIQTPTSPTLSLLASPSGLRLRWFSVVPGWIVESTSSLLPPVSWVALNLPQSTVADQVEVDLGIALTAQFYRLRRP